MSDIKFFDAFCTVGRHLRSKAGEPFSADDLLAGMDRVGISEALVVDCLSRESHPAHGNRRVRQVVEDRPRLHPAWSALPHGGADEQVRPAELIERMRRHRVGALFLFPAQHGYVLSDWAVDDFVAPLAHAGVPVFVNFNQAGNLALDACRWDELADFCRRRPDLPVVLTEWRIRRRNRLLYRALDACPNLHVELSGYWLYRGIEYLTKNWGAERLIFGSNWPHLGQDCTAATVTMAEVSEADRRLIAGDNLRRLIRWCEPERPDVELPAPPDTYARFARTGERPAEMTFLDCHGHLGGASPEYHIPDSDVESTVAEMDRMGIEKACVFSFTVVHSDERYGNDQVAEAVGSYPDRFVGFAGINPHRGRKDMLRELERCRAMGLRGIKLIPQYQGFPPEDPLIEVCCRWAHQHRWIILNHGWGSPEHLDELLGKYPNAWFIAGHANPQYGPPAREHENLWICTCPVHRPGDCEKLVEAAGAQRVLFGSDLQDLPVSWGLGPVLMAHLSPTDKQLILHDNLQGILAR
mgnify:CR=1 FL=1